MWIKVIKFRPGKASYGELVRERIDGKWRPAWRDTPEAAALVEPGVDMCRTEIVRLRDDHQGAYVRAEDILERT